VTMKLQHREGNFYLPEVLILTVSHPTRAGLDQVVVMHREGDRYRAEMRVPKSGHWLVLLEDKQKTWRLLGKTLLPAELVSIGDVNSTAPVQ
ncbi:MAG TPA: FixH family protein, partial [Rhodocyclaceae bacterium]|nr:FixH family protein [Rhodocyclaceae bacterium]